MLLMAVVVEVVGHQPWRATCGVDPPPPSRHHHRRCQLVLLTLLGVPSTHPVMQAVKQGVARVGLRDAEVRATAAVVVACAGQPVHFGKTPKPGQG